MVTFGMTPPLRFTPPSMSVSLERITDFLATVPLFRELDRSSVRGFAELTREQRFAKGAMILQEGQIERDIYYIMSGAVRVIYLSEFEEQTIRFGYEGSIINSLSSFLKESPSEFYIEAMRKTQLKVISKEMFLKLVNESTENLLQYATMLEGVIAQQIDRETDLLTTRSTSRRHGMSSSTIRPSRAYTLRARPPSSELTASTTSPSGVNRMATRFHEAYPISSDPSRSAA